MTIRLLLVDDHTAVREGIASLLSMQTDMEVLAGAGRAMDGIDLTRRLRPDVVILDINLPDLTISETLQRMLASNGNTKVLIFSMHSTPEIVSQAFYSGADGYVLKDAAGEELIAAIHAVHTGGRYICTTLRAHGIDTFLTPGRETARLARLTFRERQVLTFIADGRTSVEIAATLGVSAKSIDTYRSRIKEKLGLDNVSALVKFAIRHGLTQL